jgi:uncharacterized protein
MSTWILVATILIMLVGVAGTILPLLPGTVIVGLAAVGYAWLDGFQTIGIGMTIFIMLVAVVTGTADIWLPLLGAKAGGASVKGMVWGVVGATVGFVLGSVVPVLGSLVGAIAGYMGGIIYAEYVRHEDWNKAIQASLGGLVGWGVSTAVRLAGALFIMALFLWLIW